MPYHEERIKEQIMHLAMEFMSRESNRASLVTVTNVILLEDGAKAIVLFTVLPDDKAPAVLDFAKRKRPEFRKYVKDRCRFRVIPFFDFEIDLGEKNRQKIDELSLNA